MDSPLGPLREKLRSVALRAKAPSVPDLRDQLLRHRNEFGVDSGSSGRLDIAHAGAYSSARRCG